MSIKETPKYKKLQEALIAVNDLNIPECLQSVSLEYLLNEYMFDTECETIQSKQNNMSEQKTSSSLRGYIEKLSPKGAVVEIPCLFYWAHTRENQESLDEKGIIELYRRAGLKPPKNVIQSLRDLCSKKYGRVEAVGNGRFKLSRVGEDFVLHDV